MVLNPGERLDIAAIVRQAPAMVEPPRSLQPRPPTTPPPLQLLLSTDQPPPSPIEPSPVESQRSQVEAELEQRVDVGRDV